MHTNGKHTYRNKTTKEKLLNKIVLHTTNRKLKLLFLFSINMRQKQITKDPIVRCFPDEFERDFRNNQNNLLSEIEEDEKNIYTGIHRDTK